MAHRIISQKSDGWLDRYPAGGNRTDASDAHRVTVNCIKHGQPTIIADNVADYVNNLYRDGTTRPASFRDYPPSPPPFSQFFIEWNCPAIRYPDNKPQKELGFTQVGCQMQVYDDVPKVVEYLELHKRLGMEAEAIIGQLRWGCVGFVYVSGTNGVAFPVASTYLLLDAGGRYLTTFEYSYLAPNTQDAQERYCGSLGSQAVILMALGFMQCKNVERIDVTATEGPSPKWCRRQRVAELKYHILQIDPNLGRKSRADGRKTEGDRSGRARHFCRGHLAHFIDDGVSTGLFGRNQFGTFWIPQHERGSAEHGTVINTYNVKAPCNS
jgi:hypothetical protein